MSQTTPPGGAQPYPSPSSNEQALTFGQFRWYMEGVQHARNAVLFGVLGILTLGIVFGPLALSQCRKAEAYGIDARTGRVLGWIAIGWFCLGVLFFIAYVIFFLIFFVQAIQHRQGV
jgi:hypothetical protein